MLTLNALNAEGFAEFFELAVAGYASDNVAAGRWLERDAVELARNGNSTVAPARREYVGPLSLRYLNRGGQ